MSFASKFVADFKQGMAESAAEHAVAERKAGDRERRRRKALDPLKELEENKKLLEEVASEIENLQAERDQAQAELTEIKGLLDELSEQAEQLQAERNQLAEVLKGPGVRKLLLRTYHSDPKAAKLTAAERTALDAFAAKLNAAYDLIKNIDEAAQTAAEPADGEE